MVLKKMLLITEKEEVINRISYRKFFLCITLILFSGYGYSSDYENWWSDRPVDDRYYFGIGMIDTKDKDHVDLSQAMAMKQLTLQLFADIYSTTVRDIEENNDITIRNKYKTQTEIFTRSQLSEIEVHDTKKVKKIFYTLLRLDKKRYKEYKDKKIKDIIGAYESGIYLENDDMIGSLTHLIRAYENVLKVPGDAIYHKEKNLKNEIPIEIKSIMEGLSVTYNPRELDGQYDRSIADSLEVRVKTSNKSKAVKGLPIKFNYKRGHGDLLLTRTNTDRLGKVTNKIIKVQSREKQQTLQVFVDLSWFLSEETSKDDQNILAALNKFQESTTRSFLLNISETFSEDIALIVVGDNKYFNDADLDRLNSDFRSEFGEEKYSLVEDEDRVDEIIKKGGYARTSDLCANDACQIKIGKELGVDKLIFVNCQYFPGSKKPLWIEVTQRNMSDRKKTKIKETYKYSIERYPVLEEINNSMNVTTDRQEGTEFIGPLSKGDEENNGTNMIGTQLADFLEDNIPDLLMHFWNIQNPAYLKISHPIQMSGKLIYDKISNHWFEDDYKFKIPENGHNAYQTGDYTIRIEHVGYKPINERITLLEGTNSPPIQFIRKSSTTAFLKSLFIPGWGQVYSSEKVFRSRRNIGIAFATAGIISLITTSNAWKGYRDKRNDYEDAYDLYNRQKFIEGIETNRAIASQKNKVMHRQYTSAWYLTSISAAIWIGNAIEAHINFPDYGLANSSTDLKFAIQSISGKPSPVMQINYSW